MTSKYCGIAWRAGFTFFAKAELHGKQEPAKNLVGNRRREEALRKECLEHLRVSFRIGSACNPFAAFLSGPSNVSRSYDGWSRFDIKGIKT
jgi:hypothetical protein